jgi:phage gpG-like protein
MTSGGVDPNQWQSVGGAPNTNFLNMGNWTQGGADPGHVTPTDPQSGFQPYIDNAYSQATRQLDPQWQQQQATFDQQMVNKGIAPGSAAYDQAKTAFDQSKDDAYAQARSQAQQQGLAAQGQAFGQGLQSSQLSGALAQALIGANSQYAGQQLGGNASMMQALLGGNSNIAQQLIGADASRFSATANSGASRYAAGLNHDLGMANLNQSGQQMDFGNLMQLLNLGQGTTQYNNQLTQQDQQRQQNMWNYMPNGNAGNGNIDVQSPYNNQYNGQMNGWNYQNQQANSQNQNYAQWASIIASMYGGGG